MFFFFDVFFVKSYALHRLKTWFTLVSFSSFLGGASLEDDRSVRRNQVVDTNESRLLTPEAAESSCAR